MVHPLFDITGRKAIVTGGTRGLGHIPPRRNSARAALPATVCRPTLVGVRNATVRSERRWSSWAAIWTSS